MRLFLVAMGFRKGDALQSPWAEPGWMEVWWIEVVSCGMEPPFIWMDKWMG
jgi:hypothetical protein